MALLRSRVLAQFIARFSFVCILFGVFAFPSLSVARDESLLQGLGARPAPSGLVKLVADHRRNADVYTVSKIRVDITAPTAVEAMSTAKREAVKAAFLALLNRIVLTDDQTKIPPYDPQTSAKSVNSFKIEREKVSPTRYAAEIAVTFNRAYIHQYLDGLFIRYVDKQAPVMGLVLLFQKGYDSLPMCVAENAWCRAWDSLDLKDSVTPLLVIRDPRPYFSDPDVVDRIAHKEESVLDQVAERYGLGSLVIATLNVSSGKTVAALEHYVPALGFDRRISRSSPVSPIEMTAPFQARSLLSVVEGWWKAGNLKVKKSRDEGRFDMNVEFSFDGIDEWLALRKALTGTPGISNFRVTAVSVRGASAKVEYVGRLGKLVESLAARHIFVERSGPVWIVKPAVGLISKSAARAADDQHAADTKGEGVPTSGQKTEEQGGGNDQLKEGPPARSPLPSGSEGQAAAASFRGPSF